MPYNPERHHRHSIRLPGHDIASSGAYIAAVCVRGGGCLLGEVVDDETRLSKLGQVACDFWKQVPGQFSNVSIDALVVMPNHWHAIIVIEPSSVGGTIEEGEETSPLHNRCHTRRGAGKGR